MLERKIAHLLKRPVGRPSKKPKVFYHSFRYQAKSWDRARRVVAKVEWHAGELFPRVGFVVTNLRRSPKRVVKFYNGRGTAEQWIKEGKNALKWTRLSCRRFKDNQARLQLFALAYNLANFLRQLALPRPVRTLDADDAAGEADQDRGEGGPPRQGRDVPAGRGGGAAGVVRGDPGADRSAASGAEPRDERSPRADGSGVEPRRTGMVRREVRGQAEDRAVGGHRGVRSGIRPAGRPDFADLSPGHGHSARVQCVFRRAGRGPGRRGQRSSGKSRFSPSRHLLCGYQPLAERLAILGSEMTTKNNHFTPLDRLRGLPSLLLS